jgi:hypothetical protein
MGPLISIERDEPLKGPQLPLDLGRTELTSIELVTEKSSNIRDIKDKKRIQ